MAGTEVQVLDLSQHGRVVAMSIASGKARVVEGVERCHGFGLPYPRPFSALYFHDGELWIRVGRRIWNVAEINEVAQIQESAKRATYSFALSDGTTDTVSIKFPPTVRVVRIADPTYDEIDAWHDDIVRALPYVAADGWTSNGTEDFDGWRLRTLDHWRVGVPPP